MEYGTDYSSGRRRQQKNGIYDFVKEKYEEKGEAYFLGEEYPIGEGELELSPQNGMLYLTWKYYPDFRVLLKEDMLKNMVVFIMLFTYVSTAS